MKEQAKKLMKDRALAATPRFREENPGLFRDRPTEGRAAQREKVMKNHALMETPRFREECPWARSAGVKLHMSAAIAVKPEGEGAEKRPAAGAGQPWTSLRAFGFNQPSNQTSN